MTEQDPRLVELPVRFSQSKLWQIQRNYFASMGIFAWKEEVPFYISSNTFVAHHYALLIFNFIQDWRAQHPDSDEIFNIVELGAGTGKFSFYFLLAFTDLLEKNDLGRQRFRYIITDLIENNIKYCKENISFAPFINEHKVDFSCFNVEEDQDYYLQSAGKYYSTLVGTTPLIIIANYTFDCIKHDVFEMKDKQLHQVNLGIRSRYKNFDIKQSQHLKELRFEYQLAQADLSHYYENPMLNTMLQSYQSSFSKDGTIVMVPLGAMQFLDNMMSLTRGNFFMIAGDKGIALKEKIPLLPPQSRMTYDGCYSCNLNFHAMGEYIMAQGGDYLPTQNGNNFKVNLFNMGSHFSNLVRTRNYFESVIETTGPDEYCFLYTDIFASSYRFSLRSIISFLRYSQWDPDAYVAIYERLIEVIKAEGVECVESVYRDLEKVRKNVYRMNIGEDIYNLLGIFYQTQDLNEKALELYENSIAVFGDHAQPYHNAGMIYEKQKNYSKALACYEKAKQFDKNDKFAKRKVLALSGKPYLAAVVPILKGIFLTFIMIMAFYFIVKH